MEADAVILLDVNGLEIPVHVTRKRVKNLNLRVRSDGSVMLSLPPRASMRAAQAFLKRKADWIFRHVQDAQARAVEGCVEPGDAGSPALVPLWGELVPREDALRGGGGVDELYRAEVTRMLPQVTPAIEARVGVEAARWSVRIMKTRWGSCTPQTRAIRINARLAAYPPACLEFVVAHELVHLLEPSHNARFHALLDEFCPDNRLLAQRLKQGPVAS